MKRPLHLFEATGIELEHMIVDRETLDVRPIADRVLTAMAGETVMEVERGPIAVSNELALHVIEMKSNGPARKLTDLLDGFRKTTAEILEILERENATLLPGAMHPWMDPYAELRLWPHEESAMYAALNRVFDCRGHGWANLQSVHVNLPFANEEEMGRLHAAIRLVLPILPALAASSPIADGEVKPQLDHRIHVYGGQARRVPSVLGHVIPERVFDRASYDALLASIYRDIAPHDPDGELQFPWINARGAIVYFDRMSIEIRVLDVQECPLADLAIAAATTALVRALAEERLASRETQRAWDERDLGAIYFSCARGGDTAVMENAAYLETLGLAKSFATSRPTAGALWRALLDGPLAGDPALAPLFRDALEVILDEGCLARRILARTGPEPDRAGITRVLRELERCLRDGVMLS